MIGRWFGFRSDGETGDSSRRLAVLAAGAAATLAIGGGAAAITDVKFLYSSPQKGYLTVGAASFTPSKPYGDYLLRVDYVAHTNLSAQESEQCFVAGVNLPQGAQIDLFSIYVQSYQYGDPQVRLVRYGVANREKHNDLAILGLPSDSQIPETIRTRRVKPAVVDNQRYYYSVEACLNFGDVLYNAQIEYSYSSAGD